MHAYILESFSRRSLRTRVWRPRRRRSFAILALNTERSFTRLRSSVRVRYGIITRYWISIGWFCFAELQNWLVPVGGFPAFGTTCKFFRASVWHQFQVFPPLAPGDPGPCFTALGTICVFSRAWQQFLVFPRLAPAACRAWYQFHVLPPLASIQSFHFVVYVSCDWLYVIPSFNWPVCPVILTGSTRCKRAKPVWRRDDRNKVAPDQEYQNQMSECTWCTSSIFVYNSAIQIPLTSHSALGNCVVQCYWLIIWCF